MSILILITAAIVAYVWGELRVHIHQKKQEHLAYLKLRRIYDAVYEATMNECKNESLATSIAVDVIARYTNATSPGALAFYILLAAGELALNGRLIALAAKDPIERIFLCPRAKSGSVT